MKMYDMRDGLSAISVTKVHSSIPQLCLSQEKALLHIFVLIQSSGVEQERKEKFFDESHCRRESKKSHTSISDRERGCGCEGRCHVTQSPTLLYFLQEIDLEEGREETNFAIVRVTSSERGPGIGERKTCMATGQANRV